MFAAWALIAYEDKGMGVLAAVEVIARGDKPIELTMQKRIKQGQKKHEHQELLIVQIPFKPHRYQIQWRPS